MWLIITEGSEGGQRNTAVNISECQTVQLYHVDDKMYIDCYDSAGDQWSYPLGVCEKLPGAEVYDKLCRSFWGFLVQEGILLGSEFVSQVEDLILKERDLENPPAQLSQDGDALPPVPSP